MASTVLWLRFFGKTTFLMDWNASLVVTRIWEPAWDNFDLIEVLEVPEVVVLAEVPDFTEPREITELDEVPEGRGTFPPLDPGTLASSRLWLLAEGGSGHAAPPRPHCPWQVRGHAQ